MQEHNERVAAQIDNRNTASAPPLFIDGWYVGAKKHPAHPGRVGGPIKPRWITAHTTDMHPDDLEAILAAVSTRPSDGSAWHFLICRTEEQGLYQMVPVDRNANHAGGPHHGNLEIHGQLVHPNECCVGIEMHCAGRVRKSSGVWHFFDGPTMHGAPIPDADVTPDPDRPGFGYHKLTDYQKRTFLSLSRDLRAHALEPVPPDTRVVTCKGADPIPAYARREPQAPISGHARFDPTDRADPWPEGFELICSL